MPNFGPILRSLDLYVKELQLQTPVQVWDPLDEKFRELEAKVAERNKALHGHERAMVP